MSHVYFYCWPYITSIWPRVRLSWLSFANSNIANLHMDLLLVVWHPFSFFLTMLMSLHINGHQFLLLHVEFEVYKWESGLCNSSRRKWRRVRAGAMCSDFLVFVRTVAAVFSSGETCKNNSQICFKGLLQSIQHRSPVLCPQTVYSDEWGEKTTKIKLEHHNVPLGWSNCALTRWDWNTASTDSSTLQPGNLVCRSSSGASCLLIHLLRRRGGGGHNPEAAPKRG